MNTPLETEISGVRIYLRAVVGQSFTAEAADNTPPAAAEEPGEGEQPQDRTREACWSCDRSTCPWTCPPAVGSEQLGSCTERSYHCWEENMKKIWKMSLDMSKLSFQNSCLEGNLTQNHIQEKYYIVYH